MRPVMRPAVRSLLDRVDAQTRAATLDERLDRVMRWVSAHLRPQATHSLELDPVDIVRTGNAWCDQQAAVFLFLVWALFDLPVRQLELHHSDGVNGHFVGEVCVRGRWQLYDVHNEHTVAYRDATGRVLGRAGIVAVGASVVRAEHHWWRGVNGVGKEGFYTRAGTYPATARTQAPFGCPIRFPYEAAQWL